MPGTGERRSSRSARASARPAFVAAVVCVAFVSIAFSGCGSNNNGQQSTKITRASTSTTRAPSTSSVATSPTTAATSPTSNGTRFGYLALFPFENLQEVASWQQAYTSGGHQPWHLDAGQTALAFARFLNYTDVDRVLATRTDAKGAHVSVGFVTEGTRTATAAIVHLVRYGSGKNIPWEVVGTDDTDFTLDVPRYGATISSPGRVGGRITGVDESISVQVQQLHANGLLGHTCCVAAGDVNTPWSTTVSFAHPTDSVLIISASTGGHLKEVERFAVTGARPSS